MSTAELVPAFDVAKYKAPFPYIGGKSRVAAEVWARFGDVPNYVEPFFGSGAVLFKRPAEHDWAHRIETVNDADGMVANFWRALKGAASRAIVAGGGTISHQHGVGRDHAPYLAAEKGALGLGALAAAARCFDPAGHMNPGVLLAADGAGSQPEGRRGGRP